MLRVYSENKELLSEQAFSLTKGLNYVSYKGVVTASAAMLLETIANKGLKEDEKPIKIKPMDDGNIYLIKGKYLLRFEMNGATSETTLTLR
jgi:hypothetical protein